MEKLISMTDFVLQQREKQNKTVVTILNSIFKYANFLKQPLELWMFVPAKLVNGVWVVLEELFNDGENDQYYLSALDEYQEAKERVLFEGFGYDEMGFAYSKTQSECGFDETYMQNKKVEDLVKYNLVLTESAKKQIGL